MLYRDEVYNEHAANKGIAELLINNHDQKGWESVVLLFDAPNMRFKNLVKEAQIDYRQSKYVEK